MYIDKKGSDRVFFSVGLFYKTYISYFSNLSMLKQDRKK